MHVFSQKQKEKLLSKIFGELKVDEIQTKSKMTFQDTCENQWMRIPNKVGTIIRISVPRGGKSWG